MVIFVHNIFSNTLLMYLYIFSVLSLTFLAPLVIRIYYRYLTIELFYC